jgi:hypothetical protein
MSAEYVWDDSEWPLVRVGAPLLPAEDREFARLLERYADALRRGQPFVILFELGLGAPLSAERRDELRRHAKRHHSLLVANQYGVGIVARSAYQRATARALIWIIKPPYPIEIFADWASAQRWAAHRLAPATSRAVAARAVPLEGRTRTGKSGGQSGSWAAS